MRTLLPLLLLTSLIQQSPYTDAVDRSIKALSAEQVDGLLAGEGMGFAMAAELNRYPGPKHVLELRDELELTEPQLVQVQESFDAMRARALELGAELVAREQRLDAAFAAREITSIELQSLLSEISATRGDLRFVHLAAHLETTAALTEDQIARYDHLRGYGAHGEGHHVHGSGDSD